MARTLQGHFPYAAIAVFASLITAGQTTFGILVGAGAVAVLPMLYPDDEEGD
ncbi:hypothetical protein BH10PSE17_BH10PSE17_39170 [soil metagenome]